MGVWCGARKQTFTREEQTLTRQLTCAIAALTALAVAGCGGGSKSASTASKATSASNASSGGSSGGSSPHGSGGASSTASTAAANAGPAVTVTSKSNKLGTILAAGPKRLTVYLFEGDHGAASSCSGGCASVWPPVTTASAAVASGGAQTASLGVITRSDGTKQVTYAGHPLYFYSKDGDNGDAYGEGVHGFGADWYVLAPSGKKVDNS
jgi:predicted lipoprotein with Yx(FWY)xxD motif